MQKLKIKEINGKKAGLQIEKSDTEIRYKYIKLMHLIKELYREKEVCHV